jgi:hypothetical protein
MPSLLAETGAARAAEESHWLERLADCGAGARACGTSDSAGGRAVEGAARRAAARAGIPAVAIEDFPGNYYDVPGGQVALLVVENEAVADFTRARLGAACPSIRTLSPARYDERRRDAPALRAALGARWQEAGRERLLLWAGQPETRDCLRTLESLLPQARSRAMTVLFKAHPRDPGYRAGVYRELLVHHGTRWQYVTALAVPEALALAPDLVVTQFSSVAVEAGFHGIPSLSVLLADAGGARLLEKKGYAVPPYCTAGAAAFAHDERELSAALALLLDDRAQREKIIRCFDSYFQTGTPALPALVASLRAIRAARQNSP